MEHHGKHERRRMAIQATRGSPWRWAAVAIACGCGANEPLARPFTTLGPAATSPTSAAASMGDESADSADGGSNGGAASGAGQDGDESGQDDGACECEPGALDREEEPCDVCGVKERTRQCSSGCSWGEWSAFSECGTTRDCLPGAVETEEEVCGLCGIQTRERSCNATCQWAAWSELSECQFEGNCEPGSEQSVVLGCSVQQGKEMYTGQTTCSRVCRDNCLFPGFSCGQCVVD